MRAVTIPEFGDPEVLTWAQVSDPEPGPGEVLVDVAAAAVNRADLMQRQGHYPPPPGAPEYPGLECSGRIAALGDGVTGWQVGQEVAALLAGGGYAERVAVPAGQLLPVPAGVGLVDAAALPEVGATVWSNVVQLGGLAAGDWFLVHGGTSGIGTMALQVAAALGAHPACTVGGPAKVARAAEFGAELVIDHRSEDFVQRVREASGGHGADVLLDIIGASYLTRNVEALAADGRLVVIGMQGGTKGELDLGALLSKRISLFGTTLRARPREQKARIVAEVRDGLWPLVEAGRVRPVIDRTFPMSEAAAAHRYLEAGSHVGKVVLTR